MKLKKVLYIAAPIFAWVATVFVIYLVSKNISERGIPKELQLPYEVAPPELPKFFVVQSGSMEPAVKLGSVVIVKPQELYNPQDIISFKDGDKVITHRIIMRLHPEGPTYQPVYFTKGDVNEEMDRSVVKNADVIGKTILSLPYLGYGVDFAKKPYGFILLVIVPATIIVYEEIRSLLSQLWKLVKKVRFRKKERAPLPKASILIPSIGAFLLFVGISYSFFFDTETSSENTLGAATDFSSPTPTLTPTSTPTPTPTPGPGDVVINEINWAGSHLSDANGTNDEWIELRNMTASPIDISDWSIEGAVSGTGSLAITSGTITANGFFLISNFNQATSRINVAPDIVDPDIQLDNTDAQYILRNSSGSIVDTADDDSGAPLAGSNATPKKSMERKTPPGDGTLGGNWQTATTHTNMDGSGSTDEFATPKAANSPP